MSRNEKRIDKLSKSKLSMDKDICRIRKFVDRYLDDIDLIERQIIDHEKEIETLVHQHEERTCEQEVREEIAELTREKHEAELDVKNFDKKIQSKVRHLERSHKHKPANLK